MAVREFSLAYVPGLLQTESYARAVLSTGAVRWSGDRLENEVAVRLRRQRRLDEPGFRLTAVVDESALRRPVGGPAVMGEQLARLAERARRPNVTVLVLPNDLGAHVGLQGAFTVLDYEAPEPGIAYIAHVTGALHEDRPAEVDRVRRLFEQLVASALDRRASLALIDEAVPPGRPVATRC